MTTTEQMQKIVSWMNERPDKLFGGKYDFFEYKPFQNGEIDCYKEDNEEFVEWYTFNDIRLLRELAKAKWGDDLHTAQVYGYEWESDKCENCGIHEFYNGDSMFEKCYQYYVTKWCLIEDENERITQIAKDILS